MISGIILAAGASTRMGRPKQAVLLGGKPMLERVVATFLASRLQEVIVVLGPASTWKPSKRRRLRFAINKHPDRGISSSVRVGIESTDKRSEGAIIGLGDKPMLLWSTIDKLIDVHARFDAGVVAPVYRGTRGNPVLFSRKLYPALRRLTGDVGAKALLERGNYPVTEIPVRDIGVVLDVDTPHDLRRAERLLASRNRLDEREAP